MQVVRPFSKTRARAQVACTTRDRNKGGFLMAVTSCRADLADRLFDCVLVVTLTTLLRRLLARGSTLVAFRTVLASSSSTHCLQLHEWTVGAGGA